MEKFREFQGNDLDACIGQALDFFDCQRENLEVEIIQDAKNGIFGIVGARKAKIRARRAHLEETVATILGHVDEAVKHEGATGLASERNLPEQSAQTGQPRERKARKEHSEKRRLADKLRSAPESSATSQAGRKRQEPACKYDQPRQLEPPKDTDEDCAETSLAALDQQKLEASAREIVSALIRPLVGDDFELTPDFGHVRPRIRIEGSWDTGILIGRDGQTLIALEYLCGRLLSRAMGAPLRLRLDIGNYRARQDDKLRELALSMAERVRQTGHSLSTRPLSSYHRRVVHLALQGQPDVLTKSIGDGPLKKVLVCLKRPCQQSRP